jgi:serine/threonine protein kinase
MAVGKGGFGKVWKVEQKGTKRIYAMKLMSKAKVINKKSVSSVLNERNFLAKLSHPFIVNMANAFQDREYLYLIMDYLDGGDLRYHLGNRPFFS